MNSSAFVWTVTLVFMFSVMAVFVSADTMTSLLSAGIFIAAAVGVARWGPAATRVYFPSRDRAMPDRETRYGVLGLVLWLLSEAGKRLYNITIISLDRPDWINQLYVSPFLNAMTLAGLVLVILATTFPDERPAKVPPTMLALLAFIGVFLSASLPILAGKLVFVIEILFRTIVAAVH